MVNKFLYPRGGAESYMLSLGEGLKKLGHEVGYFGMYDEKNTVGNSLGLNTQNMDFHSKSAERFLYPFKIIYSREAYKKIGLVLDAFRPDVVHMNNINFQLTPSIIYAVKKRGIPLVQTVHDYQMICPNHLLYNFAENRACTRCVGRGKSNCVKYGCIHGSKAKSIIGVLESALYRALGTYRLPDLYICPSRFLETKLREESDIYDGKTLMLHNFVATPQKSEIRINEPQYPKMRPYVLFAGRFSYEKGVTVLVETAKRLPQYDFIFAGSGPLESELCDADNIKNIGFLGADSLTEIMRNAAVVAVPSVWYENCPLTILEAFSLGTPVVAVNSGGMAELVSDGVTGALAKDAAPECFAEAIERMLSDEKKYAFLKENCEKRKSEILTSAKYCEILVGKYKELVERNGGKS